MHATVVVSPAPGDIHARPQPHRLRPNLSRSTRPSALHSDASATGKTPPHAPTQRKPTDRCLPGAPSWQSLTALQPVQPRSRAATPPGRADAPPSSAAGSLPSRARLSSTSHGSRRSLAPPVTRQQHLPGDGPPPREGSPSGTQGVPPAPTAGAAAGEGRSCRLYA
nr:proline-rich protein HaeIII subfamily 1-like [Aegilops tauschii subsp. strangulata]